MAIAAISSVRRYGFMGSPAVRWSDSARERCRNNADGFGNGFAGIAVICVVLRKAVVQMAPRNISQG